MKKYIWTLPLAAVVYIGILVGCQFSRGNASTGPATTTPNFTGPAADRSAVLPFRGAAFQIQRMDWIGEYEKTIDELAEVGFDTVLMTVDARQENGRSSCIYLDLRMTPTPDQLGQLITHAKKKGLRVIVMPIVLLDRPTGNEWRGTIRPEFPNTWDDWFDSYRSVMNHFAWICEINKADVMVVGSELVSTQDKARQWDRTIREIRAVFRGKITYSSNWDAYMDVPFWDKMDFIGMNSYWKMGKDHNVKPQEIQKRWSEIQEELHAFQKKERKPIVFLEVGWCSLQNAAHEPWDYTKYEEPVDLDLQKRLYEGFFNSWHGVDWFGGFMVWTWTPGVGGSQDKGYTPENKPAEKVLREWLAKPKWQVKP